MHRLQHGITDVAILPRDLARSVAFYRDQVGFTVEHVMPGFVDFDGPGVRLALWERDHLRRTIGVDVDLTSPAGVMVAVRLDSTSEVDEWYERLRSQSVEFESAPADYPWNARGAYFRGPDDELWELFAWHAGGEPGHV